MNLTFENLENRSINQPNDELEAELNKLIRGTLSACETYRQVFETFKDDVELIDLKEVESDHQQAMQFFRQAAVQNGITPDEESGAWGFFAKAMTGASKVFGHTATLKTLKEGEEHGLKLYEDAVDAGVLPESLLRKIRDEYVFMQERHIDLLNRLMEKKSET